MDDYAIIIAGGAEVRKETMDKYIKNSKFLVCADKGAETAYRYGYIPDIIIGDLDSVDKNILDKMNVKIEKYPVEKDKTDLEISLEYVKKRNYKNLIIFNGLGNRIDHTLGNIMILERYEGLNIKIIDEKTEIYLLKKKEEKIKNKKGRILSIIPISESIKIKNLQGTKYILKDRIIKRGSTLGVSNIIKEEECLINLERGKALVIITKTTEGKYGSN